MKRFNWLLVGLVVLCLAIVLFAGCGSKSEHEDLQAANLEVMVVKTAAIAYYADHDGIWPATSGDLTTDYIATQIEETYTFDTTTGEISAANTLGKWGKAGFTFDVSSQQWKR